MTAAPMTVRLRANVQGFMQHLARVIGRAANFGEIPAWAKIGCPQSWIGFKSARCKDDSARFDRNHPLACFADDPFDSTALFPQKANDRALIPNFNVGRGSRFEMLFHQSLATINRP